MPKQNNLKSKFRVVFEKLKSILSVYADELTCVKDGPGDFYLDTKQIMKNKKPTFFGAVRITKGTSKQDVCSALPSPYEAPGCRWGRPALFAGMPLSFIVKTDSMRP